MLGALAVLTAGAAHAELLEYTFKAPDGTQRSLTPNANFIYAPYLSRNKLMSTLRWHSRFK
ncbi:DUF4165 domain-containing protein [Providencia stuartii]|uniref:DUF4165 domain-containing protein n=1 Tax=Providencia stuartii TaxID=588 RepID=UPI00331BB625